MQTHPTQPHVQFPGTIYHVMNRGDLEKMDGQFVDNHSGEERRESAEEKGARIRAI